jgi:hypothetical protein
MEERREENIEHRTPNIERRSEEEGVEETEKCMRGG